MIRDKFELRIERPVWDHDYSIYLFGTSESELSTSYVNTEILLKTVKAYEKPTKLVSLDDNAVQQTMNDLWNLGVRPSEVLRPEISEKDHIKDLRAEIEFNRVLLQKLVK